MKGLLKLVRTRQDLERFAALCARRGVGLRVGGQDAAPGTLSSRRDVERARSSGHIEQLLELVYPDGPPGRLRALALAQVWLAPGLQVWPKANWDRAIRLLGGRGAQRPADADLIVGSDVLAARRAWPGGLAPIPLMFDEPRVIHDMVPARVQSLMLAPRGSERARALPRIRTLLRDPDIDHQRQGVALAAALDDEDLATSLLIGLRWERGRIVPGRLLEGISEQALLELLAAAASHPLAQPFLSATDLKAKLTDLAPIAAFSALEELDLSLSSLADLRTLPPSPRLRVLDVSGAVPMTALDGVSAAPNLERLCVRRCRGLTSLGDLSCLPKLQILEARDTPLTELDGLAGCRALETVNLQGCGSMRGIGALAGCRTLRALHLDDSPDVAPVEVLARLPALETLSLAPPAAARLALALAAHLPPDPDPQ